MNAKDEGNLHVDERSHVMGRVRVPRAIAGACALEALSAGRGRVAAVFQRSLYLEGAAGLACVGGNDLLPGPVNLCLEGVDDLAAHLVHPRPGDPWELASRSLRLGEVTVLELPEVSPWTPPPAAAFSAGALARNLACCREAMARRSPGGDLPGPAGRAVAQRLRVGMASLSHWLRDAVSGSGGSPAVPDTALSLLGCGPGLTPSGDDILVGALVALHQWRFTGAARALGDGVRTEMSLRTGAISGAHLSAACEGLAVEPVHGLVNWLSAGAPGDPDGCVDRLCRHGHSSGADALAGIMLAAEELVDRGA